MRSKSRDQVLSHAQMKKSKPIVIAMIGLVGSGKTTVAKELAKITRGVRVDGDDIRLALRKEGKDFSSVRRIAISTALGAIRLGRSVVLSSDFVSKANQAELRKLCRKAGVGLYLVQVLCDPDIIIGRIIDGDPGDFFDHAKSVHKGKDRGRVIRLREFWRRSPNHYNWSAKNGGQWKPKSPRLPNLFSVDTSDGKSWKAEVRKIAKTLTRR